MYWWQNASSFSIFVRAPLHQLHVPRAYCIPMRSSVQSAVRAGVEVTLGSCVVAQVQRRLGSPAHGSSINFAQQHRPLNRYYRYCFRFDVHVGRATFFKLPNMLFAYCTNWAHRISTCFMLLKHFGQNMRGKPFL